MREIASAKLPISSLDLLLIAASMSPTLILSATSVNFLIGLPIALPK
jgi:hypothetical protein